MKERKNEEIETVHLAPANFLEVSQVIFIPNPSAPVEELERDESIENGSNIILEEIPACIHQQPSRGQSDEMLKVKIKELGECIKELQIKAISLQSCRKDKNDKYGLAATEADDLYNKLSMVLAVFEASNKEKKDYLQFALASRIAIKKHSPRLEKHRDYRWIIGNIAGFIAGIGVIYGLVVLANYCLNHKKVTFFQTEAEKKVDKIGRAIDAIEPR